MNSIFLLALLVVLQQIVIGICSNLVSWMILECLMEDKKNPQNESKKEE